MSRMSTPDPFRLDDKHVLITGAGGGIGRALVAVFNAAGAIVTGCDRDEKLLSAVPVAHRLVFELTDAEAVAQAVGAHIAAHGAPAALVSNAGFTRAESFAGLDAETWAHEVDINLNGSYNIVAPVVEAMAGVGGGSVVFVSSVNALAHYGNPAYAAAKAGLIAYARGLAVERGRDGIRANVVAPGSVRTPAWDHRLEKDPNLLAKVLPHYPLGRLVAPEDVAHAALFLAAPASAGITGITMPVDAGLTAGNLRFVTDVLKGE
jgi:NAD(P)-dependent dehydrogenase (short-subunit alcohol dehydrogenase family)